MEKHLRRISHGGKEILFVDFANTSEQESLAAWDELKEALVKERGAILALIDARNTKMSLDILNKARDVAGTLKSIPGTRVAFVGMSTLQKSAAQIHAGAIHLKVHFPATLEEGKDWLVSSQSSHSEGMRQGPGDK